MTRPFVATIQRDMATEACLSESARDLFFFAVPMDIRLPKIRIKTRQVRCWNQLTWGREGILFDFFPL